MEPAADQGRRRLFLFAQSKMNRFLPSPLRACCALFFIGIATYLGALDFSLGGSSSSSVAVPYFSAPLYAWFDFTPIGIVSGDTVNGSIGWELRIAPRAQGRTSPAEASIAEGRSSLSLTFAGGLAVRAGWFLDETRAAELFPQTTSFGPADPLSRFETGGASTERDEEPMIRVGYAGDWWRLSAQVAPFEPELVVPRIDSPWFPASLVPSSFKIAGSTYTLQNLAYDKSSISLGSTTTSTLTPDPAWSASAGASLGPVDIDAYYFDGLERTPVLYGRADLAGSGYSFNVDLVPVRSHIRKIAASATWVADAIRLWGESSWVRGSTFATGSVDWPFLNAGSYILPGSTLSITQTPPIIRVDRLGTTCGASYNPDTGFVIITFFLEATYNWYYGTPVWSKAPLLSRAAGGGFMIADQTGRLEANLGGLLSLTDWSFALRPSLRIGFGGDRDLEIGFPLFGGPVDSEFGQFSTLRYVTVALNQRF